jgi:hypothetical protein
MRASWWLLEQIFKDFLPAGVDSNLKIDNLGELKIVNFNPEQLNHKEFIGKVLLEVDESTFA